MTRKPPPSTKPVIGPDRSGLPSCPCCTFVGRPTADATPYVVCGGDETRHQRAPVAEQFRTPEPPPPPPPAPKPVAPPTAPPPLDHGTAWRKGLRGRCGTCNRAVGVLPGPDGPVTWGHKQNGGPCPGSGWPPRELVAS
jgi:hypothetical protein